SNALSYLLFLRLVPAFPFWFVNIAPALLGVPLRTYVVATFFGIIPATFAFAAAGASLDSVIMAAKSDYMSCVAKHGAHACKLQIHASELFTRELLLALVLLGCAALIPVGLKKWRGSHAAGKCGCGRREALGHRRWCGAEPHGAGYRRLAVHRGGRCARRSVHHRRRRGRAVARRRRCPAGRVGRPHRGRQDGRRLPQPRL